jgi:hypothetical protein
MTKHHRRTKHHQCTHIYTIGKQSEATYSWQCAEQKTLDIHTQRRYQRNAWSVCICAKQRNATQRKTHDSLYAHTRHACT